MGDPHCAPYYSKCTQVVGTEEGTFDLWTVPGKISFEINVYAKAGKKMDQSAYQRRTGNLQRRPLL